MRDDQREKITKVVDTLQRELELLEATGEQLKVKVKGSAEHARRLKLLAEELKALTSERKT